MLHKSLINELVNDGIKLSKLEINTGFINGLPKKWLSFYQSLRNTNNVKDSELASLFRKLKYKENLIDSIYETEKNKSLVSATPLSTTVPFFSSSIVWDFQDIPDDEEDTRSSQEYLNDLEEEYQARALLAKSKRFFKKFSTSQSPFQTKPFSSPQCKPELRPTKDFEAKYNKVKAKLALLSSSASASKTHMIKNKGLIAEAYEWDEEEVSSDDNEMVSNKVNQCISEQIPCQKKKILGVDQLTEDPSSSGLKDLFPSPTDYDSVDESSVCSNPLPPLKKLEGVEPISRPNTIKSILKSKSTLKTKALKGVIINEPSLAPVKGNKSSSASKVHSAHAGKLKSVKIKDDPSLAKISHPTPKVINHNKFHKMHFRTNTKHNSKGVMIYVA
ncbi:hypothetical protein Tco_0850035 [Tanacetum coccineum]